MLRGKLQVWEQTDTALTRVMCSAAGVNFWATCWRGLELPEEDNPELPNSGGGHTLGDDEDERRRIVAQRNRRRVRMAGSSSSGTIAASLRQPCPDRSRPSWCRIAHRRCTSICPWFRVYIVPLFSLIQGGARYAQGGVSLNDSTVEQIHKWLQLAKQGAEQGHKKMLTNDYTCIPIFRQSLDHLGNATAQMMELGGLGESLVDEDTGGLQDKLTRWLQQAEHAVNSQSALSKLDREEYQANPSGVVDLRGKENVKALAHRALTTAAKSIVQGVVRVENPTLYADFDPALGTVLKPPRLQMHQTVDALEVRQGNVLGYLTEGDYFGEACLVAQTNEGSRFDRNVTAFTDSELCYLRKEDVGELAAEFPELEEQIRIFAKLRKGLEEPRRKFNEVDKDAGGFLDRGELKALLESLGTIDEEEISDGINEMDWEGDGEVSYDEFEAWWFRNQQKRNTEVADTDGPELEPHGAADPPAGDGARLAIVEEKVGRVEEKVDRVEEKLDAVRQTLEQLVQHLGSSVAQ